jgi:hypothetical protein
MPGSDEIYKITVCVPEEYLERMMDRINEVMGPLYPGYDRAFSYSLSVGTWRPLEGSSPFKGRVNEIEVADEIRLEFIVRGNDVKNVVKAVADVHPYEEPGIDLMRVHHWKEFI